MRFNDIISIAAQGVRERKFRFALNIIGILIGGAAIVSLVSVAEGMNVEVNKQIELLGPTTITVSTSGFGFVRGGGGTLTYRELNNIEKIPHVVLATPVISRTALVRVGGHSAQIQIVGIVPDEYVKVVKNLEVDKGRFLERSDVVSVVLGANIAHPPDEDSPLAGVGDRIVIDVRIGEEERTATFRVAGVLKPLGSMIFMSPDDTVYITTRSAQQLFESGNRISTIAVEADSLETIDTVVDAIKDRLWEGVIVISAGFIRDMVGRIMGIIEAVLGGVSAISLVVAGVGIINTMTVSVMERTREIGILKAIGAKSRDVLMMFLTEALITGVLGGMIGVLLGIVLSQVVSSLAQFTIGVTMSPSTSLGIAVLVVLFSTTTGAIAGLYPAWRAAKLRPVEALRYE